MTKEIIKEGVALAEKEQRDKQVQEVKNITLRTLEKLKEQEKNRDEAIEKIKILKMDLEDLKEGKLDRMVERQEKDEKARQISVVVITKIEEHNHYYNPWYVPYRIVWNVPSSPFMPTIYNGGSICMSTFTDTVGTVTTNGTNMPYGLITCSTAKDATIGTYTLSNDEIVYVR